MRQKLGWLFLDHLRVCSIGARLPWSDWSRRYVGLVGNAPARRTCCSSRDVQSAARDASQCRRFGSSFDGDDTHVGAMLHPGVAARAAALAVAEHKGIRGPDVLAAVVAGCETTIRVGLSVQPGHFKRGFQSTGTCVGFGTAAAAGRCCSGATGRRSPTRSALRAATPAGSHSSTTPAVRRSASMRRTRPERWCPPRCRERRLCGAQ